MIRIKQVDLKQAIIVSLILHVIFILLGTRVLNRDNDIIRVSIPVELVTEEPLADIQEKKEPKKKQVKKKIVKPKPQKIKETKKQAPKKIKKIEQKNKQVEKIKEQKKQIEAKPVKSKTRSRVVNSNTSKPKFASKVNRVDDFPFKYYIRIIETKIKRNWSYPKDVTGDMHAVVFFKISRTGELLELRMHKKSLSHAFDQRIQDAVNAAVPFPPLPDGYDKEFLGVYFEFEFKA